MGQRGASPTYRYRAIATVATPKSPFRLGGRQAQGFVESLFELIDIRLPVLDHSTVSRRLGALSVAMPVQPATGGRHVVVDSMANYRLGNFLKSSIIISAPPLAKAPPSMP